jgi:hypothetical protein
MFAKVKDTSPLESQEENVEHLNFDELPERFRRVVVSELEGDIINSGTNEVYI